MKSWRLTMGLAGALAGSAGAAFAQPPARPPVKVGPTTVTVIDTNESVDDVISRVREARRLEREKAGPGDKDKDRDKNPQAGSDRTAGDKGPKDKPDKPGQDRERIKKVKDGIKERRQDRESKVLQRRGER